MSNFGHQRVPDFMLNLNCEASMLIFPKLLRHNSPSQSSRNGQKVRLIVIHDCEGSFAGSVAWFANASAQVSAHIVLDEDGSQAVQMVPWDQKAWHSCYFNGVSEGIEAAGYASKGLGEPEWQALANIVAFRLRANGLPPVWAKGGIGEGFEQHAGLGVAGGGHHDVTNDPAIWNHFVALVQAAYAAPMPASWDAEGDHVIAPVPPTWRPSHTVRHDFETGSVAWVQMRLNALGVPATPLAVDGVEGSETLAAIEEFQQERGLDVDGVAGTKTIAALS